MADRVCPHSDLLCDGLSAGYDDALSRYPFTIMYGNLQVPEIAI